MSISISSNFMTTVLALLEKDRKDWKDTAKEIGVSYEWLVKLSAGQIKDPGFQKMVDLHSYLDNKYTVEATENDTQ